MLQRSIFVWLLASSGLAWYWPQLGASVDPFLWLGAPAINVLITVAMFSVGALLPVDEVNQLKTRWPSVMLGTIVQYSSMPFLAWAAVQIARPSPELATGIILVGCVPGAMASNVLTMIARGHVSYSVSLTTLATLISPVVVPLALKLTLGQDVQYDGMAAVRLMILQIVLPTIVGHLCSRVSAVFQRTATVAAPTVANVAILAIIAIAVGLKRDQVSNAPEVLLPLLGMNIGGYLAGYVLGGVFRLTRPMRRALTLEVGMQNAGAGTALAIQLFGGDSAAIVPCVAYTIACMLTGTLLATVWSCFPPESDQDDGGTAV